MRKSTLFFSIALMLLTGNLFGNDIYIFFDDSCMDSYEYEQIMKQSNRQIKEDFQSYSVKINDNERILLEIGKLKTNESKSAPSATKYCGDIDYNELFARKINSKNQKVFMVIPNATGSGYHIQQVHRAIYFFSTSAELGFSSPDATFAYSYSTTGKWVKKNFASKGSKNKIYFSKRNDATCPSEYIFKASKKKRSKIYSSLTLVPDIGLIKKIRTEDKNKSASSQYILKSINNIDLARYMDAVCNGYVEYLEAEESGKVLSKPSTGAVTTTSTSIITDGVIISEASGKSISDIYKDIDKGFYFDRTSGAKAQGVYGGISYHNGLRVASGYTPATPTTTVVSSTPTPTVTPVYVSYTSTPATPVYATAVRTTPEVTVGACGIVAEVNHHVVEKGQTLYRISKLYNVSIDQLKQWNSIGSNNIISVCSQIKVANNSTATSYSYTSKGSPTTYSTPTPHIVASTTPAVPISYNAPSVVTSKNHVVKKGETLYSISKMYGVSIDFIKSENALNTNTISIGQSLNLSAAPTAYSAPVTSYNTGATMTAKGVPTVTWDVPQAVKIPASYSNGTTNKGAIDIIPHKGIRNIHMVQDNETIFSIAKMYNRTVQELYKINKLNKNEIIIPGQKLYLD